jgi:hypothetical protein
MNYAHLHIALNHVPVLGSVFGMLLLAYASLRGSNEVKKVGLAVFVVSALLAIPVYLTGEPAEHMLGQVGGATDAIIEQHEESAAFALAGILVLGAAGLGGLVLFRGARPVPNWFAAAVLIVSLASAGILLRTANLGGQVRHEEIRGNAPPVSAER